MNQPLPAPPLAPDLYALSPKALWRQFWQEPASFWFICGYLLFEYVRPQTIYPALDVLPWSTMMIAGAILARFARPRPDSSRAPLSKWMVLYGIVVLLSSLVGFDPANSFENLHWYFNWLIIYFAIVWTVRSRSQFFIFFLLYMLANFKMSQHGFLSWAMNGFSFDSHGTGGPGWLRNSGEFGIQMCIFTPLAAALALALRHYCSRTVRWLLYFIPISGIGSVIASASRGALVGLAASVLWSLRTTGYFFRTLIVVCALSGLIYLALPAEFMDRMADSGTDRTSLVRLDRWEKGWETMKKYPVLGVGHKNWEAYYGENLNYGLPGTRMVHNIFIESGTEHGFAGLATLCLLLLSMFFVNARTRALAKERGDIFSVYVAHGLDGATLGMIISSSFVTVLYYPYVWIHAAFVSALHVSVQAGTQRVTTKQRMQARQAVPARVKS